MAMATTWEWQHHDNGNIMAMATLADIRAPHQMPLHRSTSWQLKTTLKKIMIAFGKTGNILILKQVKVNKKIKSGLQ